MIPVKLAKRLARLRFQNNGDHHQIYFSEPPIGDTHRTARHTNHYYACGKAARVDDQRIGPSRDGLSDFTCLRCRDEANRERLECYTAPTRIRIERTHYGINFPEDMARVEVSGVAVVFREFMTIKETLLTLSRHRNWLKHRAWVQFSARRHPDLDMPFTTREAIMYWIQDEARHLDQQRTAAMTTHKCPNCHILMTEGAIHAIECRHRPAAWSNEPRKL